MIGYLLQNGANSTINTTQLSQGDPFGPILSIFTGPVPVPIVALLVFGTIGVAYYIVQRSVAIPLVMFLLVGGSTIARAPISIQEGIVAALVVVVAGIGYIILVRVEV